ncbi:hypothetical protein Pint_29094 [Pistacia integerrima]|uniref:Uncharacterized protein n=1 Tax=Pistacia integerrima TaxID=434235 RepID=A0ACC0X0Q9_9ROSI|nr:hypothetical protein Pint_29094 [Pistacia integerrima]
MVNAILIDYKLGNLHNIQYLSTTFTGAAFDLLKKYPDLVSKTEDRGRVLEALANKPLAFASGSQLGYLQQLIYHFPGIKLIRDIKLMHKQTDEIVRLMCHEGVIWSTDAALKSLRVPILTAARLGIYEIVREILDAYYYSYCFWDENGHAIFHIAIIHRQDKVFSLLNKLDLFLWEWKAASKVEKTDNILHLTGRLVPSDQVPGAALQMQKELKWFKAVKSYVHPSLQEQRNGSNKTPKEVFTKEHKKLVKEGEKWMKETASSCIVAAALIITVVFAAAFTLPGGNDNDGTPNFLSKKSFKAFIIFDALALFSSSASLLMFMGIVASRYSEEDFLEYLPKNFIMGHIALLLSVICMMIAFGETMFMILSHKWLPLYLPISFVGCLTMILFSRLQFPLLIEMFLSTYERSVF